MSKKLAIKGHETRGEEIIEILEMMGGNDDGTWWGNDKRSAYFINDCTQKIDVCTVETDIIVFTLEEFLQIYPFKVGDRVMDGYGNTLTIKSMKWSEDFETMVYDFVETEDVLCGEDLMNWNMVPTNKETDETKLSDGKHKRIHEDVIFDSIIWHLRNSINNGKQNLSGGECEEYFREVVKKNNENKMKNVLAELLEHIKTTPKEDLEREFEEIKEWSNVGPTVEEFRTFCECVNKKPKYPKTFKECCERVNACPTVGISYNSNEDMLYNDEVDLALLALRKLLICRDAY